MIFCGPVALVLWANKICICRSAIIQYMWIGSILKKHLLRHAATNNQALTNILAFYTQPKDIQKI